MDGNVSIETIFFIVRLYCNRSGQLQIVRDRLQNFLQARDRPVNDALQKSQNFLLTFSVGLLPPYL